MKQACCVNAHLCMWDNQLVLCTEDIIIARTVAVCMTVLMKFLKQKQLSSSMTFVKMFTVERLNM